MKTKLTIDSAIEKIEKIIAESEYSSTGYQEYWYSWKIAKWEKYDKVRIYINLTYGRTHRGSRKWTRGCKFYIDITEKKYRDVSEQYNNAGERHFIEHICQDIVEEL